MGVGCIFDQGTSPRIHVRSSREGFINRLRKEGYSSDKTKNNANLIRESYIILNKLHSKPLQSIKNNIIHNYVSAELKVDAKWIKNDTVATHSNSNYAKWGLK